GAVYIYDAGKDTWSKGPPIAPRGTAGAVVYRGAIFVFGGESQRRNKTLNDVLRLDPKTNHWRRVNGMPTARNYARAVLLKEAGLVDERRNGTRRLYRARPEGLAELKAFLDDFWGDHLDALKREAEREERKKHGKRN